MTDSVTGSVDIAVFSSVEVEDAEVSDSSTFSVVVVLSGTLPTTESALLARRASMMVAEALSASELYCHAEELTFLLITSNRTYFDQLHVALSTNAEKKYAPELILDNPGILERCRGVNVENFLEGVEVFRVDLASLVVTRSTNQSQRCEKGKREQVIPARSRSREEQPALPSRDRS